MKTKKIWPIILIVIIIAAAAGVIIFNSTDAARFRKQLNLGQRYLSEMNYEEAVVAFNQAIEIDPRSVDAYLGLADAYIGLGDEEAALAALQAGYEATGDERLKARIDGMMASREEDNEQAGFGDNIDDTAANVRIEEIVELISGQTGGIDSTGMNHLLTYDQIETAYRPLVEELETWLEEQGEEGVGNALYADAWNALSLGYLHLGEMEQCLESRRKGYRMTEWDFLKPEICDRKRVIPSSAAVWDEYGRIIESGGSVTYGEADREIRWEENVDGVNIVRQIEYDNLGRVSKSVQTWTDDGYDVVQEYEYEGGNTVIITGHSTGNPPSYAILSYDGYGRHLNELEWNEGAAGGQNNAHEE